MYSNYNIKELLLLKNQSNKKLIFVHTPKCGGTYVASILSHLKIINKKHVKAIPNEGITFTVIRDPIKRFESMLNYRLNRPRHRTLFPINLIYVFDDETITLNEIVSKMTNVQILGFFPYSTLVYWTENIDIIITLENLPKMLGYFGYTYDANLFKPLNVSKKIRGTLNDENINRLKTLFSDDVLLYNKVTNSTL